VEGVLRSSVHDIRRPTFSRNVHREGQRIVYAGFLGEGTICRRGTKRA
jgi:hypothetical protein